MNQRTAYFIAAGIGVAIEFVFAAAAGTMEAWDAPPFWVAGIPLAILSCGLLGYLAPPGARWYGPILMGALFATMILTSGAGALLPIGLILCGILSLPCIGLAVGGAFLRRRHDRKRDAS